MRADVLPCCRRSVISSRSVQGYTPDPNRLPAFLLHMARDVEWDDEKPCFRTLAATLAEFYSLQEPLDVQRPQRGGADPRRHSSLVQRKSGTTPTAVSQAEGGSSEPAHAAPSEIAAGVDAPEPAPPHRNCSTVQADPQTGGEQDTVEAALAAQRPYPNLSASAPVSDAVVAEAVENNNEARPGVNSAALQSPPTTAKQGESAEQAAEAVGTMPMEAAMVPTVSAAEAGRPGGDSPKAAASSYEAEDDRAWTIQHVRR